MTKNPRILLLYTGGTIGMIKDYETGALRPFNFEKIQERIPELNQLSCEIDTVSFDELIDSSNMNVIYWNQITEIIKKNYTKYDGFVILTGSDTMAYTSSAISFMLENLQKPVIFTGSQLPIGDLRTDAKENLITSIHIAASQIEDRPIIQEVCLYFEYKLYRANRTTKINADQFEAFTSMNLPALAESGVHLKFNEHLLLGTGDFQEDLIVRNNMVSDVVILKMFPGITEPTVRAILNIPNLKGVVLETYGSGNAPTEAWFISLLKEAISKNIRIVDVTQCLGGSVILGHYETSQELLKIGILNGKDITTESAIVKLMYLLGEQLSFEEFKKYFEMSLRGELT